ncbi:helix-turn-helix domain-containing protein [Fictibacillus sp. S7]|uniref:helix-turn-helix domain-containing protein n=1 Tax=Fictibacillus sp. S7 TaxID=2212476 RepID=UPI00102602B4|nr:hypothetical protein DMO16_23520 [Fictibacillus sp. S7]
MGGRPSIPQKEIERALKLYKTKEYTVPEIVEMTGVSKATLYRSLKRVAKWWSHTLENYRKLQFIYTLKIS